MMLSKIKIATLLMTVSYTLPVLAEYRMFYPLEVAKQGSLPDGSISFGDGTKPPDSGVPPSTNCIYDDGGTLVIKLKGDDGKFKAGDQFYWYNGMMIAWHSPSNGFTPPAGLSIGEFKFNNPSDPNNDLHALCANDPASYPEFIPPQAPEEPEEDTSGPDYTPECLPLDTTNNYSAYDDITGKHEFHSVTYGLNHIESGRKYIPPDYDPNRAGSYIYLREMNDSVLGPKPNNWYNAVCRVKKIA